MELVPVISEADMAAFRQWVKVWLENDTYVKNVQADIRERKKLLKVLAGKITSFMTKYGIDDCSTKEGVLKCKVAVVNKPLNKLMIKSRIEDSLRDDDERCKQILTNVFNPTEKIERTSLRRLKNN
jgi:hypothetical protein